MRARILGNSFFKLGPPLLKCRSHLEPGAGSSKAAARAMGQVHVVEIEENSLDAACHGL